MTKRALRSLLAGVLLAAAAVPAAAGRANYAETQVDLNTRIAFGSLYDTRHSADSVQYIGCYMSLAGGSARLTCEATDAGGDNLVCISTNAELLKIAQSINDNGYVYFQCDAGNVLTYLYVSTNSIWLP